MSSSPRTMALAALCAVVCAVPATALGAEDSAASLAWGSMLMQLFGGLGLFLFGLDQLSEGLKAAAGGRLKSILTRFTGSRVTAALTGAGLTALIQSSSVTTVLAVGFVASGVMSFQQSIGVILGANVGTTFTAQMLAFRIDALAPGFIAVGFAMNAFGRRESIRSLGLVALGLGLLFLGMMTMSEGMRPLRDWDPFISLMGQMDHPFLGVAVGAAFTALVQSSSATSGVVIALAGSGLITLEAGIALTLGANLGTCATAALAAIGKPVAARRAAAIHVLFNGIGVAAWIGLIPLLAALAIAVSPAAPELDEAARLMAETPRRIANANTIFNLANTAIMIGFTGALAALVARLVPDRESPSEAAPPARWLDSGLLALPDAALDATRRQLVEIALILENMGAIVAEAGRRRDRVALTKARRLDDDIDALHLAVMRYLAELQRRDLTGEQTQTLRALHLAAYELEAMGDLLGERTIDVLDRWIGEGQRATPQVEPILAELLIATRRAASEAGRAIAAADSQAAAAAQATHAEADRLSADAIAVQASHLGKTAPERLTALRLEIDLVAVLRALCGHAARAASAGALKE